MMARNVLYNLLGYGLPLAVAFFSIPRLIEGLGATKFGILSLMWMILGYFSVFDLGLGRALTQQVAARPAAAAEIATTGLMMMLALGVAGGGVMAALSNVLVHSVWQVPAALAAETESAFLIVALCLPAVIVTVGLRGLLEAQHRFSAVNILRVPMGIYTFVAPLWAVGRPNELVAVAWVLAVGRFLGWAAHAALCLRAMPEIRRTVWSPELASTLLRSGGWMTISNVVNPVLVSLDRFMIASLVSVAGVAYYATPYEAVTKLWMVPAALGGVFFPAFAGTFSRDEGRTRALYRQGMVWSAALLLPICLLVIVFARLGLAYWLGPEFAARSTLVLQWLTAGVFFSSLAGVPFALIQAAGRPDLTAKLHLIELPFYIGGLWLAIVAWGVTGAAAAWTVRMTLDALALGLLSRRILSASGAAKEVLDA